jgi:hypothetical protein
MIVIRELFGKLDERRQLPYGKEVCMSRLVGIPPAGSLLALALLISCGVARAEPSGEADFRMSCSACHGEDGRGA